MSEEDRLQITCIEWFDLQPKFKKFQKCLFHPANGGKRNKIEGKKFKRMGVRAGVSDLVYCRNGLVYFIELKTATGRQQPSQKEFAEQVGQEYYYIVRSLEAFVNLIELINLDHQTKEL